MKRQPKDPFNGMGHFVPQPKKTKAKAAAKPPKRTRNAVTNTPPSRRPRSATSAAVKAIFADIRQSAEAARARLAMNNPRMVAADFEWIIQLADDGLKAG